MCATPNLYMRFKTHICACICSQTLLCTCMCSKINFDHLHLFNRPSAARAFLQTPFVIHWVSWWSFCKGYEPEIQPHIQPAVCAPELVYAPSLYVYICMYVVRAPNGMCACMYSQTCICACLRSKTHMCACMCFQTRICTHMCSKIYFNHPTLFTRPGAANSFLQTPLRFIESVSHPFVRRNNVKLNWTSS